MTPFDARTRRGEALLETVARIELNHGKGAIMRLGAASPLGVEATSSGALALDDALGVGGYPKGRIVEIFGAEASGKTTLALHALAEAQKAGGIAAFVDVEHALDAAYAARLGVDTEHLLVSQPDDGEQALALTEALVRTGAVDLVVVDSVAALVPRAELAGEGDALGAQARLMSRALRKLSAALKSSRCTVIFVNQVREKLGPLCGNAEVTVGGLALCFYASLRLSVRRTVLLVAAGENPPHGQRTCVRVVKNKVAAPFRTAEFDLLFGQGIDRAGCLFDTAVARGLLTQGATGYAYGAQPLGEGREAALRQLTAQPELARELEAHLRLWGAAEATPPATTSEAS